jgi:hypothetical protein
MVESVTLFGDDILSEEIVNEFPLLASCRVASSVFIRDGVWCILGAMSEIRPDKT